MTLSVASGPGAEKVRPDRDAPQARRLAAEEMMPENLPDDVDRGRLIVLGVLFEAALAPLAVLLGWLLGQPALAGFAWRAEDVALGALATLPMLALFLIGQTWPVGPFRSIKRFFDEEARPVLAGCSWSDLALVSMAAGVGEEMLFRGVFQAALSHWLGAAPGWAAASILFGLLHPISSSYIALAAVMGAYLGAVWIYSGNLLTVMVAHALYDFVALWLLLRKEPAAA
jgi:membrane protease YdiL (CAAX protease family)